MTNTFVPIKLTGLNASASRPSERGSAMTVVVLDLSDRAPPEWSDYFNAAWQQHIYSMKRRAHVSGARLEIDCELSELESDHIPELQKIMDETNMEYAKFALGRDKAAKAEQAQKDARTAQLGELAKKIKFD
jgi:hypothetical protein